MIRQLLLSDWKSFKSCEFDIDSLTILIGSNASGKSNALDALQFLNRVSLGLGLFQAINGDRNTTPLRGGAEWVCRKPKTSFSIKTIFDNPLSENKEYAYEFKVKIGKSNALVTDESLKLLTYGPRDGTKEVVLYKSSSEKNAPGIKGYFYTGTKGKGKRIDFNSSHLIISQVQALDLHHLVKDGIDEVMSSLKGIFLFDPIPSHMRDYSAFSDQLQSDGSNVSGVLAALGKRKQAIEDQLTKYMQKLPEQDISRVWTEPVGKFGADAMLYCSENWKGNETHEIDARGMSDGTIRYLGIVTALLTRPKGSLLIVEEIDNGLHPSRAKILIKMLKTLGSERSVDIVLTTHNPALLDAAGNKMVQFITVAHRDLKNGCSRLTHLDEISDLPKLMSMGSIGKISSDGRLEASLKGL